MPVWQQPASAYHCFSMLARRRFAMESYGMGNLLLVSSSALARHMFGFYLCGIRKKGIPVTQGALLIVRSI